MVEFQIKHSHITVHCNLKYEPEKCGGTWTTYKQKYVIEIMNTFGNVTVNSCISSGNSVPLSTITVMNPLYSGRSFLPVGVLNTK